MTTRNLDVTDPSKDQPGQRTDPEALERFVQAQAGIYEQVLVELRRGHKETHWMWFIFPQVAGLGFSATSRHYAIRDLQEACQYLQHPLLGNRLRECARILLEIPARSAREIFDPPDDLKLHSCMTLFAQAASSDPVFNQNLERYFHGEADKKTLEILKRMNK
jgi:uncharacterized protein (DUF1810 family)